MQLKFGKETGEYVDSTGQYAVKYSHSDSILLEKESLI